MSIESLYLFFVAGTVWTVGIEMYGKYREGAAIQRAKSAKGNSRTSKIISLGCIGWQVITLSLGLVIGRNNWVPIAILGPIMIMYLWLLYLCFKYKKSKYNILDIK